MTLIEGIGDEVVEFVITVLVVIIASLAWWSTNSRPDRYRTLLLMRSRPTHPVTVSIRTRSFVSHMQSVNSSPSITVEPAASPATSRAENGNRVIPVQEMDSIVDADMAMLDNNRLHFYRVVESQNTNQSTTEASSEPDTQDQREPASEEQIREMDTIVSAMEADISVNRERNADPTSKSENTQSSSSNINTEPSGASVGEETTSESSNSKILIKLKYLNDTLKEVEASLDELLKDFKLRHFSVELSAARRVRLIFKGRVLCDERATLRACGLHHRAVVHCLVHHARPAAPTHTQQQQTVPEPMGVTHELITEALQPERSWDLENILMTLVSFALTVVWFFRCEYSNMFTASASVALFGLTVFYSVAVFGLYLSDTFHFYRRPTQQLPNN